MSDFKVSQNKILVTGGTGLLGSELLRQLVELGGTIRAIRRATSRMDLVKNFQEKIEWVEADLLDIGALEDAFEGITHVFHCGAVVSFSSKYAEKMKQINVEGTANVVNLSLDFGIKKLIYVSSVAAIGRTIGKNDIDEATKWENSAANSNYALTKYLAEQEVWRGISEGLNAAMVNPAIILGDGFFDEGSIRFFRQIKNGLKFYPPGGSGFVDARDVADFMIRLMDSEISAERFLLCGENVKYQSFFEMVAQKLNVDPPKYLVKKWMAECAWIFGFFQQKIFGVEPMVTRETARNSLETWVYQNKKSLKKFPDFNYRTLAETIDFCGDRFLEKG
jgi:dihydroflavonol-4-reductase